MWAQEFYHPITQVRRTVLLAVKTAIVYFAAVSVFRLHVVRRPMNAADFILKSAHFVFKAMCVGSGRDRHFLAPYTVIWPAFWERAGRNAAQSVVLSFVFLSDIPVRAGMCGPGAKGNAEAVVTGESSEHIPRTYGADAPISDQQYRMNRKKGDIPQKQNAASLPAAKR